MHDALVDVAHREELDAELGAVASQGLTWFFAPGSMMGRGWVGHFVVVVGVYGAFRAANRAAGQSQAVERLGAGHLVQQVEVDVEKVGLTLGPTHHVCVPYLLGQRACHD